MRQSKKQKWIVALTSVLALAAIGGIATNPSAVAANADSTYYYWHVSKGQGNYAVSINTRAYTQSAGYVGVETKVTRANGTVEDLGVTLNGSVEPLWSSGDVGKNFIYFDYEVFPAEAIAITFTSSVDCTKQVSIITTERDNKLYYTVAFTDDITVQDGYAYVEGAKTVGSTGYDLEGIFGYGTDGAERAGRDVIAHIGKDGMVYVDNVEWTKVADLNDESFLNASKAALPADSEYADRYTVENVNAMLSEINEKGCAMSINYYGLKTDTVDFHLRGYTGHTTEGKQSYQWIDEGGKELESSCLRPLFYQKKTKVYKYGTYKVQDLIGAYSFAGDSSMFTGFDGCDATGQGGTSYTYAEETTVTFGDSDKYISIAGQDGKENYGDGKCYQFKVLDSTPVVTTEGEQTFVSGAKYNLTELFEVFVPIGGQTTAVYKVDGSEISNADAWIMDNATHTITLEVTDGQHQTGTASFIVSPFDITLTDNVTITKEMGDIEYFPVPVLPNDAVYSVALFDASADETSATPYTTNVAYSFGNSGNYKAVYTIWLAGLDSPIKKTVAYTVTVLEKTPQISVGTEYKDSYFTGKELDIVAATANNGTERKFTVNCELFKDNVSVKTGAGKYTLATAGDYELVYSVSLDDGRKAEKKYAFTVSQDSEKPTIVVNGSYADSYDTGTVIPVLEATAFDNDEASLTATVYHDGEAVSVENNQLTLQKGTYKIVFSAVDNSGNQADDVSFEFTVTGDEKGGCGGCNDSIDGVALPIIVLIGMLAVVRLTKKSKREE